MLSSLAIERKTMSNLNLTKIVYHNDEEGNDKINYNKNNSHNNHNRNQIIIVVIIAVTLRIIPIVFLKKGSAERQ